VGKPKRDDQFSRRVNANFMDLCTMEFCKLFAERSGKHHWRKVITDQDTFFPGLLEAVGKTEPEFVEYIRQMKFYRDKYVAHLDEETGGNYPHLGPGKNAAAYLFDYVVKKENDDDFFPDKPQSAAEFYAARQAEGQAAYK
jgi:hypothetical protein